MCILFYFSFQDWEQTTGITFMSSDLKSSELHRLRRFAMLLITRDEKGPLMQKGLQRKHVGSVDCFNVTLS